MIRSAERYIADGISGKIALSATTRLTFERHAADLRVAPERLVYLSDSDPSGLNIPVVR